MGGVDRAEVDRAQLDIAISNVGKLAGGLVGEADAGGRRSRLATCVEGSADGGCG